MKKILGYILLFIGGFMMGHNGFSLFTWEYWAVVVPMLTGSDLVARSKFDENN